MAESDRLIAAEAGYRTGKTMLGIICILVVGIELAITLPPALRTLRQWHRELHSVNFHALVEAGDYLQLHRILHDAPVNFDIADQQGRTPLHLAVQLRRTAIAELLLSKGADANRLIDSAQRATPLHLAAARGDVEMITLLLHYHANPSVVTRDGLTPRQLALKLHHPAAAKLLSDWR